MLQTKLVQVVPAQHGPLHGMFSMDSEGGIPCLFSQTLEEKIQNYVLTWQSCVGESWNMQAQVFHAPLVLSLPSHEQQYHEPLVPAPRWVLEFIISPGVTWNLWSQQLTGWHKLIHLRPRFQGLFKEVFFERFPLLTTEPHTPPHLPNNGEVEILLLIWQSGKRKSSVSFSF